MQRPQTSQAESCDLRPDSKHSIQLHDRGYLRMGPWTLTVRWRLALPVVMGMHSVQQVWRGSSSLGQREQVGNSLHEGSVDPMERVLRLEWPYGLSRVGARDEASGPWPVTGCMLMGEEALFTWGQFLKRTDN